MSVHDFYEQCNTGDVILYEVPYAVPNLFHFIPSLFLGTNHIGIVVKDKNGIYLLECDSVYRECIYSKKVKNGVMLNKIEKRTKTDEAEMYFIKTNLHNKINPDNVIPFIEKYTNVNYAEKGLNCISFYLTFLQEFSLLKMNYLVIPPYTNYETILSKDFYNFDYKNEIYHLI
jgi:hypothetical protein